MYEVSKDGAIICRFAEERSVAAFLFGVTWGAGSKEPIIDYWITLDGKPVMKTLIVAKYFPKEGN